MEENSSILINLCSQKYFRDIFAKSSKSLAFTSPDLDILWANANFRNLFEQMDSLSELANGANANGVFTMHIQIGNIQGSLLLFPIIYQNKLLGYTTLFVPGNNENDLFELKAAKHDLNNLLTIVFNLLHLTDNDNLANAGLVIAKDFLENYSLNVIAPSEILDIKETLNILINSLTGSLPGIITFKWDISPDLHKLKINKTKFIRIISNLITNAVEAIPEGGNIILSAFNITVNGKNYVCIKVADTGCGIPSKEIKNIFTKDYSTKKRGSGLGLSIVKQLLDEINSSIEVKSKKDTGTEFLLKFPAASCLTKRIAIIEDEAPINELLTDLLSVSYSVSSYLDGNSFLSDTNLTVYDLIIIDKKLPGINGIECIRQLRKKDKKVKIILATGSEMDNKMNSELPAIDIIISKPYKFDQLLSVVEELLA